MSHCGGCSSTRKDGLMPTIQLASHWPAGTKVSVQRRTGDWYAPSEQVRTASVSKAGELSVDVPEGRYWAVADVEVVGPGGQTETVPRAVGFTSKETPAPKERTPAPTSADFSTHPGVLPGARIVTGPRGTRVGERLVEEPVGRGVEPHPHLNQASIGEKVPQRSNTPLGEATPADPSEPQPKPTQEAVKKGTPQRSETETGEAAVVTEDAGPERQEDVGKSAKQRSRTPTGEATPVGSAEPRGTSSNPDSREQAAGERPTDEKPKGRGVSRPKAARKVKKS